MIIWMLLTAALTATAHEDDLESIHQRFYRLGCVKASRSQIATINRGNAKKDLFLTRCATATQDSAWCAQLIRPNPESNAIFDCTYGNSQVHQLIHPDEATWKNAFAAVNIVEELTRSGIQICQIYNWWRPEPYNKNVGGAPSRHPLGTSVDVRFCSKEDQDKGFLKMCDLRKEGRVRAVGYYPSAALHFGVGDAKANTWGKDCP